jgi:ribosomal protein S18 acetylase RimI-like enzyme
VQEDIAPPVMGQERLQAVVRERPTGRLVAWWWTDPQPQSARLRVDLYVHPDLSEADGDALAATGWAEVTRWAGERYAGWQGETPYLDAGSLQDDTATERRLRAADFAPVRTFWRMGGDVPAQPSPPPPVTGLAIRQARFGPAGATDDDTRLVHDLKERTFAEHWGQVAEPYDAFLARWSSSAGFDPALWFVAELDGEPVALMLASRRMADENALYVQTLGTLAAFRGRGIAAALLHHAFEVARREGYSSVRLGVDSDNATGAPSVYRRAGLDVLFAAHAWHKPLG